MPRHLFDRLTNHDHAPRCRYDAAEGIAEFVAAPGVAHESRAWIWSAEDGASIWIPDASLHQGFVKADESCVFPSLGRDDLDELLADCGTEEQFRLSHRLAERIAAELAIG